MLAITSSVLGYKDDTCIWSFISVPSEHFHRVKIIAQLKGRIANKYIESEGI